MIITIKTPIYEVLNIEVQLPLYSMLFVGIENADITIYRCLLEEDKLLSITKTVKYDEDESTTYTIDTSRPNLTSENISKYEGQGVYHLAKEEFETVLNKFCESIK
jgi:hypothetical protein